MSGIWGALHQVARTASYFFCIARVFQTAHRFGVIVFRLPNIERWFPVKLILPPVLSLINHASHSDVTSRYLLVVSYYPSNFMHHLQWGFEMALAVVYAYYSRTKFSGHPC